MMVRWNLLGTSIVAVVSSATWSAIATMAALASAMAFFVPRMEMVALSLSSAALSTSIWTPMVSLMSLMVEPALPRIRATERAGTVNLTTLFDSFSNSTACKKS